MHFTLILSSTLTPFIESLSLRFSNVNIICASFFLSLLHVDMFSPLHLPIFHFFLTSGIFMQKVVEEETKEMCSQKNSPFATAHTGYVQLPGTLDSSMVKNQQWLMNKTIKFSPFFFNILFMNFLWSLFLEELPVVNFLPWILVV